MILPGLDRRLRVASNRPRNGPLDAEHGYALPNRDIHDKRAGNRDWELGFAMFRRLLPL